MNLTNEDRLFLFNLCKCKNGIILKNPINGVSRNLIGEWVIEKYLNEQYQYFPTDKCISHQEDFNIEKEIESYSTGCDFELL